MTAPTTTTTLPLAPGTWTLDKNHSGVLFVVRHLGLSNVRGRFDSFDATLDVGSDLSEVSVTADVDLSSVDTNNADRDAHLRGTDFFDTEQHSAMTFRSTSVTGSGEDYELTGDLTIASTTKPVTFDVEFHGTEVFPA
ncbi:MAG: YceI family protein, partial [Acidimicrobiia bacterium]